MQSLVTQNQNNPTKSFIMVSKENLAAMPIFSQLNEVERESIASITEKKFFFMGNSIYKEGDSGGQLFFVHKGVVKITLPIHKNIKQRLSIKKSGDFFGNVSFLDNQKQNSAAVCVTDSMIFIINKIYFDELSRTNPALGVKILKSINHSLCSRLRKITYDINNMVRSVHSVD